MKKKNIKKTLLIIAAVGTVLLLASPFVLWHGSSAINTNVEGDNPYSDAVVRLSLESWGNNEQAFEFWYVLPSGQCVHETEMADGTFSSMTVCTVDSADCILQIFNEPPTLVDDGTSQTGFQGYKLFIDFDKKAYTIKETDSDGAVIEQDDEEDYTVYPSVTIDWDALAVLMRHSLG